MITRRTFLFMSTLPATFAVLTMDGPSARAETMMSKKMADYQYRPHDGQRCAGCCMFVPGPPSRCTMIAGAIDPNGWCKYWKAGPADTCS